MVDIPFVPPKSGENVPSDTPPSKPISTAPVAPAAKPINVARGPVSTKLSAEQRAKLKSQRQSSRALIAALQKLIIVLLVVVVGGFYWFKFNLDEDKNILSVFGVAENLGMRHKNLAQKLRDKNREKRVIEQKIAKLQNQLDTGQYSVFSTEIEKLRNEQIVWFDRTAENGNFIFGMMNVAPRMVHFFNDREFSDPAKILSGRPEQIQISEVTVDRSGLKMNVTGSELFGKVFFLNLEFVKMVNSFPFLKNGEITAFSRREDSEGNPFMKYTIKFDAQFADEEDPNDQYFEQYLSWLKNRKTTSNTTVEKRTVRTLSSPETE
jgi:hypothetical protein